MPYYGFKVTGNKQKPIAVAVLSKAWVCGRLLAGIDGSNLAGDMDVCALWLLGVVR
jgi:hypothetical protein